MNHNIDLKNRLSISYVILLGSLGCFSGLGVLNSEVGIAQTLASVESSDRSESLAVPSAQGLLEQPPSVAPPEIIPVSPIQNQTTLSIPFNTPSVDVEGAEAEPAALLGETLPLVAPNLTERAAALQNGSSYIDATPYDLGSTPYAPPESVIISERSTGCQKALVQSQALTSNVCASESTASNRSDSRRSGSIDWASSKNSGSINTVNIGSINLSATGRTTPEGRDYYRLTLRPPAMMGNGNISLIFPLSIPAAITSAFGWRIHPITGEGRLHSGVDMGADQGVPVLAAFSGKVAMADLMGGYGLAVMLEHNKGSQQTLYAHMSELFVKPGETVKQGEVIGRVGSTGLSTGPHLHFEFRQLEEGGWQTMDAGQALEFSLAKLIQGLQVGQTMAINPAVDPLQQLKQVLLKTKDGKTKSQTTFVKPSLSLGSDS